MTMLFTGKYDEPARKLIDDGSIYGNGVNPEPIICGLCRKKTGIAVTHEIDGYVMLICPVCNERNR